MTITHNFQQESVFLLHNAIVQVSKALFIFLRNSYGSEYFFSRKFQCMNTSYETSHVIWILQIMWINYRVIKWVCGSEADFSNAFWVLRGHDSYREKLPISFDISFCHCLVKFINAPFPINFVASKSCKFSMVTTQEKN